MKIHPHMLRHACGFKLANDGVDTRTIQAYLGHIVDPAYGALLFSPPSRGISDAASWAEHILSYPLINDCLRLRDQSPMMLG
jgi:hypothetical protein